MDTSGQVQSVDLVAPTCYYAQKTPRTKVPVPTLITIKWKDGQISELTNPEMLGDGASRDVLGSQENTTWVVKIQLWTWHDSSNGYEYQLATDLLEPFTPRMLGCVRCAYKTAKGDYILSVLVVVRIPKTLQLYICDLLREPADLSAVRLLLGMIQSLFNIVKKACGDRKAKLTDLKTDNIGVDENNRVVLLDVESAMIVMVMDITIWI